MKTINYFTKSIKNETLKLKNTFALWLAIISALFIPAIFFFYYLLKFESLMAPEGTNPWEKFMVDQINSAASLLVPLFIILVTSLIVQVEHKSSSIKHLFSLPIPKWSVYFGKLIVSIGLIVFTYALFFLAMLIVGVLVGFIHKELNFLEYYPNYLKPVKLLFRSFMAILGILGIQFWLSFRIKNFIIPLGIGIVLVVTGLIIFKAQESIYFPYAYNTISLFPLTQEEANIDLWFPKVSVLSIVYFVTFSILGFLSIKSMSIK